MLLSSINVGAEEDVKDDTDLNDRKENNETTVTYIKMDQGNSSPSKNRPNKARENVSE